MAPSEPRMQSFLGRVLVASTVTRLLKKSTVRRLDLSLVGVPTAGIGMSVPHMAANRGETSASEYCVALWWTMPPVIASTKCNETEGGGAHE